MKKLCKILTAFVLTVTMVTNMAPQALFAADGFDFKAIVKDPVFRAAIINKLKETNPSITEEVVTKDDLANMRGKILVTDPNLSSIAGMSYLGKYDANDMRNPVDVEANNTKLSTLLAEHEAEQNPGFYAPNLLLANNRITDISRDSAAAGANIGTFDFQGQKVEFTKEFFKDDSKLELEINKLDFRFDRIDARAKDIRKINLTGTLKDETGQWPTSNGLNGNPAVTLNKNSVPATAIFNDADLQTGIVEIGNLENDTDAKINWLKQVSYLGNNNRWSGVFTLPVKVSYLQEVKVDPNEKGENNGTAVLADNAASGYYKFNSNVVATATPDAFRQVQYWKTVADDKVDNKDVEIPSNGSSENNGNVYKVNGLTNVNHIRTKFTHIADIKNVTNIPNIDAKDTGKVWVDVADRDTVYDGNQSNFFEGSTGINDTEDRIFHYEPATNFLLDKVEVDGDEAKVEVNKDTGTITVKNMQADQHIKVSFKEARKYKVETVVAENGLTSENSTTIDQGKDANPNGKAIYVDVEDSTSKPGISGGTDNVNIHIIPQNDYVIESVVAESTAYDVDGNPIKGPETHVFDGAKGIGNNDGKGFKATLPAIHEDWKITVTFKAVNAIETNVVANGIVKPGVSLDDGINGGTVNGVNTPTNISNIKRGDNQKVVVSPKKDPNDIYQINKITVSEKVGDKYVSLTKEREAELGLDLKLDTAAGTSEDFTIDFKNIRNDFKVEASFYKTHKIPVTAVDNDYYSKNHKDGDTLDNGKDGGTFNNDLLSIPRGDNRDVIVKAKPGYVIESITIKHADNTSTSVDITDPAEMKVPFQNIRSDAEVFVAFVAKYNIDTEIIENGTPFAGDNGLNGGTITPDESDIHRGLDRSVVINAKEGYTISKIIIDGKEIEIGEDLTTYTVPFNNMKDNHEVKVAFVKINEVINKVVGEYPDGGTISPSVKLPDGTGYIIVITPNEGFEVDLDTLKNTGGVITVNDDGTVTITYDHVIKDEFNEVGFKKKPVAPKPAEPTPPTPEKPAPKAEAPTGDTTSTLPLAGLAVASLAACGIILKKRKSNMK